MQNFDDKRNFYRMMLNSDVTVTILDDEVNKTVTAVCRDLSSTGMAIELTYPLELNTSVHINIASLNNTVQPLDVKGKVIRITEESNSCYLIGISITEMD